VDASSGPGGGEESSWEFSNFCEHIEVVSSALVVSFVAVKEYNFLSEPLARYGVIDVAKSEGKEEIFSVGGVSFLKEFGPRCFEYLVYRYEFLTCVEWDVCFSCGHSCWAYGFKFSDLDFQSGFDWFGF